LTPLNSSKANSTAKLFVPELVLLSIWNVVVSDGRMDGAPAAIQIITCPDALGEDVKNVLLIAPITQVRPAVTGVAGGIGVEQPAPDAVAHVMHTNRLPAVVLLRKPAALVVSV
jgi:hypothetical protein